MRKSLRTFLIPLIASLALVLAGTAQSQTANNPHAGYFLAPDETGIQQVYQLLLDIPSDPRQITFATEDVVTFGASYDMLAVAYVSAGQLWLQSTHTDVTEALAEVGASQIFNGPIFSQDGQYVAYADDGVWLLDLGTRETTQLLEDKPLSEAGNTPGDSRMYSPKQFVLDETGDVAHLIVDVQLYEWNSEGVYDLETGEWQELGVSLADVMPSLPDGVTLSNMLPLADGRVLVYGGYVGEVSLYVADSLDALVVEDPELYRLFPGRATLFPTQAVELSPGLVRVFGSATINTPETNAFYFDFDVDGFTLPGDIDLTLLSTADESDNTVAGALSPDGNFVPAYLNARFTDAGSIYGEVRLLNVTDGTQISVSLPEMLGEFVWQP